MPKAASLAAAIKSAYNIEPQMVQLSGGIFEVYSSGQLIFSKKATGRFPTNEEVMEAIRKQ